MNFGACLLATLLTLFQAVLPYPGPVQTSGGSAKSFTSVQVASNTCSACTTLTVTLTATGTGHLLFASVVFTNGTTGGISSITGGGTWTLETTAGTGCAQTDSNPFGGVACAYILSNTTSTTSVAFTFSASNNYTVTVYNYSYTGTCSKDTSASVLDNTSSTTLAGVALTLAGGNEALFQFIEVGGQYTLTISSPYTLDEQNQNVGTAGTASDINGTSGTAPTWTSSTASTAVGGAIAFKLA